MATPTQKRLNRTVEEINPLLDKLDEDYTKAEIDTYLEGKQSVPTISTVQYTAAQADTYELVTGITHTLTAGSTAVITASAINRNGAISGIKLSTSSTLMDGSTIAVSESADSYRALSCNCVYTASSSNETLYVFVKYTSAVENDVTLCVQ